MFVCCECCLLSGRCLCDGSITRPEESYRLWRVVVCDQETSNTKRLKAASGLWKIQPQWVVRPGKQTNKLVISKWSGYSQRQPKDLTEKVAHELRWQLSRIDLFYRSLFVVVMFHGTQTELYFTSNYCFDHPHFYKNSLPEEPLPSLHSRQNNIAVNTEDGITV
jgi:hypothetical protein